MTPDFSFFDGMEWKAGSPTSPRRLPPTNSLEDPRVLPLPSSLRSWRETIWLGCPSQRGPGSLIEAGPSSQSCLCARSRRLRHDATPFSLAEQRPQRDSLARWCSVSVDAAGLWGLDRRLVDVCVTHLVSTTHTPKTHPHPHTGTPRRETDGQHAGLQAAGGGDRQCHAVAGQWVRGITRKWTKVEWERVVATEVWLYWMNPFVHGTDCLPCLFPTTPSIDRWIDRPTDRSTDSGKQAGQQQVSVPRKTVNIEPKVCSGFFTDHFSLPSTSVPHTQPIPPINPPTPQQVVQIAAAPAVIGGGDGPIKVSSEAAKPPASGAGSTKSPNKAAGGRVGSPVVSATAAAAGYVTEGGKDIKAKYEIDPREIGHGHYGVVRKARYVEAGIVVCCVVLGWDVGVWVDGWKGTDARGLTRLDPTGAGRRARCSRSRRSVSPR